MLHNFLRKNSDVCCRLEQIEELGLKTLDEDELIALLENAVGKRLTNDLDDDDEQPKITRTKRQKR